jgi:pimeloyl-ACP methyl ester carboxylesterase
MKTPSKTNKKRLWLKLGIGLDSFLILNTLVQLIGTPFIYQAIFSRKDSLEEEDALGAIDYSSLATSYPRSAFSFTVDGATLQGHVYDNPKSEKAIIIAPGMGSNEESYLTYVTGFYDAGYDILTYNDTGSFSSAGSSLKGFPQSIRDLQGLLNYLPELQGFSKETYGAFGHSWGAYAASHVLSPTCPLKAVVAVSGCNTAEEAVLGSARRKVSILADLSWPFLITYQRLMFGELSSQSAVSTLNSVSTPVLVAHGKEDVTFPYEKESISSHQKEITNPNVSYYLGEGEEGSHSGILYSEKANAYRQSVQKEKPRTVDTSLYNEVNPDLFQAALALYKAL